METRDAHVGISLGFPRERWTLLWDLTINGWPNEWKNITWQCFIKSDSRYLYEYIILYIISCITFRLYNSFTQSTSIHCPSWVNSTLIFRKVYVSSLSYILKVKSSSLLINTYKFSLRDWYYKFKWSDIYLVVLIYGN